MFYFYSLGVKRLEGISKVIDELGLIILSKDIEIDIKQKEIDKLKNTIETLELYLETYDVFCGKK